MPSAAGSSVPTVERVSPILPGTNPTTTTATGTAIPTTVHADGAGRRSGAAAPAS
jgi:hypothetical protein